MRRQPLASNQLRAGATSHSRPWSAYRPAGVRAASRSRPTHRPSRERFPWAVHGRGPPNSLSAGGRAVGNAGPRLDAPLDSGDVRSRRMPSAQLGARDRHSARARSVFHRPSRGAVPQNNRAPVGGRWETRTIDSTRLFDWGDVPWWMMRSAKPGARVRRRCSVAGRWPRDGRHQRAGYRSSAASSGSVPQPGVFGTYR